MKRSLCDTDENRSCKETRQDVSSKANSQENITATTSNVGAMDPDVLRRHLFEEFDGNRGLYEPDLFYERNWRYRWVECKKHPGHADFIPREDFSMEHLPDEAKHPEFLDYFKCVADMTCRLVVSHISPNRPNGFPGTAFRGQDMCIVGSGMVQPFNHKMHTNEPCPCEQCQTSNDPHNVWAEVFVRTLASNVCGDDEAKCTRVDMFYDAEVDLDESVGRVRSLHGVSVKVYSDFGADNVCTLRSITHDVELYNTIQDKLKHLCDLKVRVEKLYKEKDALEQWPWGNVCVIPSHPHGSFKHLTVGSVKYSQSDEEQENDVSSLDYSLVYEACTCPGSSGAPVLCVGSVDRKWVDSTGNAVPARHGLQQWDEVWWIKLSHPHHSSATRAPGVNKSGLGILF